MIVLTRMRFGELQGRFRDLGDGLGLKQLRVVRVLHSLRSQEVSRNAQVPDCDHARLVL